MAQSFTDIILPGWEVVRKLGEGSFGGVYEIQRTLPDGTVERAALKKLTVPKDPGEIEELYARSYDSASITAHFKEQMQDLVREYAFMQKLGENPNVVHCQDLRTIQHNDGIGWDIYIRMELLKPLKKWLDDRYDERRVIRLGLNICGALNGCHQRNIIHRDIKPENILVTDDGRFKLGDFGIAKVSEKTATGTLTGTYSYMAPEIANRQHYGASADIYSLGLVMYWMMNERTLPFLPLSKKIPSGIQRQEAQDRRLSGEQIPAPINGSLELTEIVLKACAFDPQERYHSVQELAEDLKWHYQNMRSGTVRKPKPTNQPRTDGWEEPTLGTGETYVPPQPEPPKKKRKLWKSLGMAVLIGLIIGGSIRLASSIPQKKEPTPTENTTPSETDPGSIDARIPCEVIVEKSQDSGVLCLEIGHHWLLNVQCYPEDCTDQITYQSEDPEIVTVTEDGKLQAKGIGETEVVISCGSQILKIRIAVGEPLANKQADGIQDGNSILLGRYEQDNNTINGPEPIEWEVLSSNEDTVILISKYALDCHSSTERESWENSEIRKWLNGTFWETAFDSEEKSRIVALRNDGVEDYVSLCGWDVAEDVPFECIDDILCCVPSPYAISRGVEASTGFRSDGQSSCDWWLRDSMIVSLSGYNIVEFSGKAAVRPIICVRIE